MICTTLLHFQWLHISVAALVYFILGSVWYSVLFGKQWIAAHKIDITAPNAKEGMARMFTISFICMTVNVIAIAFIQHHLGCVNLMAGLKVGLFLGFCFNACGMSINYIYLKKPLTAFVIDGAYQTIGCGIAGAILGAWH